MTSVLDDRFLLTDLLDMSVIKEVGEAYCRAFELGIIILNEAGEEVINLCPPYEFCKAIQAGALAPKCGDAKKRLARHPIEESQVLQLKSGCGMRYVLLLLSYQLETLGRVIVGPFRDPETPAGQLARTLGPEIKEDQIRQVPAMTPERLKSGISLLAKMLNGFLFINAKRLITTRLHLETIYGEKERIFRQVEYQDYGSAEDRAEIEKFKNMF
ncbi:MAG TPA: PocR ligand-binding domain-containing protein [bacterium]|nr:PocR ligand-binding domain-containing protein [bacterium]